MRAMWHGHLGVEKLRSVFRLSLRVGSGLPCLLTPAAERHRRERAGMLSPRGPSSIYTRRLAAGDSSYVVVGSERGDSNEDRTPDQGTFRPWLSQGYTVD